MQGRNRALVFGLVAAIAVAAVLIALTIQDRGSEDAAPNDQSSGGDMAAGFGGDDVKAQLWKRLSAYRQTHLKSWDKAFQTPRPSAGTVLKAFNHVLGQVTGPNGFWRDQVPNTLFECHLNADTQVCESLEEAHGEFADWDQLSGQIDRLSDSRADVFLTRNAKRIESYLDTYVPATDDEAGMKKTAFFAQRLQKFLAGAETDEPAAP